MSRRTSSSIARQSGSAADSPNDTWPGSLAGRDERGAPPTTSSCSRTDSRRTACSRPTWTRSRAQYASARRCSTRHSCFANSGTGKKTSTKKSAIVGRDGIVAFEVDCGVAFRVATLFWKRRGALGR